MKGREKEGKKEIKRELFEIRNSSSEKLLVEYHSCSQLSIDGMNPKRGWILVLDRIYICINQVNENIFS